VKKYFIITVIIFKWNIVFSQDSKELDFSLFRQNDHIEIKEVNTIYKKFKKLRLSENSTLSFGGSSRFQTEAFINEQFDKNQDQTDYWLLNRLMLHSHLKLGGHFELFLEVNSSLIRSKDDLSPVDKDQLNINQLFAKYSFNKNWNALIGRQNLRLGSGRLVDLREGPNVRLSFDMVQLQYQNKKTKITSFYGQPVKQQQGFFDNDMLTGCESLTGLYWTQNWSKKTNTDIYLLYKEEKNKIWNADIANDDRLSIGLRHFGIWKRFKYNNEFVYQFGEFGNQNISAWTVSFNIEKNFSFGALGLKTEAISGNDDSNGTLNTFDALYPRGAYFGRVARFGPSNLIDVHPYFKTKWENLIIELDYVAFWRYSTTDGIYNPALILEYPSINKECFIGQQIGIVLGYKVNTFINLELESNIIFPGTFLQESGFRDNLYHFVFTTEIKF
jgi:hypothetical protein